MQKRSYSAFSCIYFSAASPVLQQSAAICLWSTGKFPLHVALFPTL